jgi:acyl-CoA thioester hydrolase
LSAAAGHWWRVRIYYEDTDAGGIVYHASYLRFFERARTEWLRALGLDHPTLRDRFGVMFAVRRLEIAYRSPARLDDELEIATTLERAEGARLVLGQRAERGRTAICEARIELVVVNSQLRPSRLPEPLRARLEGLGAPPDKGS